MDITTSTTINRNKDLVIYHGNCNDGFGSAFAHWFWTGRTPYTKSNIVSIVLPPKEKQQYNVIETTTTYYVEGFYYQEFPWVFAREEFNIKRVCIVDFSYEPEVLREICSKFPYVVVIDHHKKFIDSVKDTVALPTNLHLLLNDTQSGAQLCWSYFSGLPTHVAPLMIDHIGDWDTWKFKINETREFIQALRSYPATFEEWFEIYMRTDREPHKSYEEFIAEGKAILRYTDNVIAGIIKSTKCGITLYDKDNNPIEGLCCNAPGILASDIGNILAKESGTFGLSWYTASDETIACSIRSIGEFDVNEIAKVYGGGGHKNASGFTLSNLDEMHYHLNRYHI